jgi:sugar lactone lactonase YvrE
MGAFFWTDWAGTSLRMLNWDPSLRYPQSMIEEMASRSDLSDDEFEQVFKESQKVYTIELTPLPDGVVPTVKSMGEIEAGVFIAAFANHGIGRIILTAGETEGTLLGVTELLSSVPLEGKPEAVIMNDGKVSPDGRFFVGQMYIDGLIDLGTGEVLNNDIWPYMNTDDNGGLLQTEVY